MRPTSEADLSELISTATAALSIIGGGTRMIGLPAGDALCTRGLSGITLYEPGALTMVAKAGTPLAEIKTAVAAENQRLAFEPADLRDVLGTKGESTIGGVVSVNASGPRRISAGACRDFMLGVRFVDGTGAIVKNGGRVMKNVTGYDLVKLLSGAHGTLGVLSEVSLKVLPKVEMQLCLQLKDLDDSKAVAAMSSALGSPYEVSGAARNLDGTVVLRLEGFEASVRYRAKELTRLLAHFGKVSCLDDQSQCTALWRDIRDARGFVGTGGDLWRISVKPSDAPRLIKAIDADTTLLDWGGGLIWANMPKGADLRTRMCVAGHATLMRADSCTFQKLARFQPEPASLAKISANLRARFDPKGLLNPGLMGAPL